MLKLCLAIAAILDFLSTQKHKFCNEPLKAIPSYVYFQMIHWFQMGIIVKYFNNIKTLFCNGDHPGFLTDTKKKNYYRVCNQINTTGATSGAGTAYPSGAPEFTPSFSGVRVTRSLVLYVFFLDRCLSFCTFSFDHCVVCSSSIYGF